MLPTTSDPCGQIAYSRPTKPRKTSRSARIDWQLTQNHSLFARYMLSTTFWEPAFVNADGNILAATLGGRDNTQHSLAIGDSMVLSNTMVNNIRVSVNRTSVLRTHADLFGPEDVGIKMFTYIPELHEHHDHRRLLDQHRDGDLLVLQAEHLLRLRRPDDRPREPPVRLRRRGVRCPTGRRNRTSARWARSRSTAA